jgi:hypothetical protein
VCGEGLQAEEKGVLLAVERPGDALLHHLLQRDALCCNAHGRAMQRDVPWGFGGKQAERVQPAAARTGRSSKLPRSFG